MPKQKISMPDDIYGGPTGGAIDKLTGGANQQPQPKAVTPATTEPAAAPPAKGNTRNLKPTSFYLTPQQIKKLDDLAYVYNGRTGKRINRNDIIRHWIDTQDIGSLQGI